MKPDIDLAENGNITLTLTIPWENVQKAYNSEVDSAVADAEITGFRKGKAPRNLVEPNLNKDKLYSQAIQRLIPQVYAAVIKKHDLKPILNPKLTLTKGEEGFDWQFQAVTCESPTVTLPTNYLQEIKKIRPPTSDKKIESLLDFLHQKTAVKIPDLLVEEESSHRITHLIENITRLGLTTESYLQTKKLSPEELKAQTATQARTDLAMEYILNQVKADQNLSDRKATLDFLSSLV